MRYKPEHKQQTRGRIMAAAARLFRKHGYEGTGVDAIMAEAGLTPGGFYSHFANKEALLVETLSKSLAEGAAKLARAASKSSDPFGGVVARYLNRAHRDNPAGGCPLPCLTAEVGRLTPAARRQFTRSLERYLVGVEACMPGGSPGQQRRRVLVTLSTLVGAMTLARAVSDKALSEEIFESTRNALLAERRTPPKPRAPARASRRRARPAAARG